MDNQNHKTSNEVDNQETYWQKIKNFYNKNYKELYVVFTLIVLFNFICIGNNSKNIQLGGASEMEMLAKSAGGAGAIGAVGKKGILSKVKNTNVLSTLLSWMFSLVQSFITFAGLIIALAVLPGLPVFIFMLILFFILRARVAAIKSY
jgi:flagellar biosynthesis component FlhA